MITVPPLSGAPGAYRPPQKSSAGVMIAVILAAVLGGLLVCGGIIAALLLPAVGSAREAARRSMCMNNLKQIGLAMHNYHDVYRCFPAAVLTDEDGQPMRSWRVAILPFNEQQPLFDQYDFSEPWDGPNNRALHGTPVPTYRCPSDGDPTATDTSYVMVVGKGTIGGEPNETVKIAHVTDGTSNTIMAIEVGTSGIHWMEPRDVTVEEAVTFLTNPAASEFQQVHPGGANVVLADSSVRFLAESTDPDTVRALLTRDDGQAVRPDF
jgi:prepilin-type processing-associated H-X9-DG protein